MTLHQLLKNRVSYAKSFTKDFIDEVKRSLGDYECKNDEIVKKSGDHNKHDWHKRYEFPIPYIYSTHESMLSSLYESMPELVLTDKGRKDEEKANLIKSIYRYLYDKLDLEQFLVDSAWWYLLVGFTSSYQTYKVEIDHEEPAIGVDGLPLLDEKGNLVTRPIYKYHDPIAVVDDPQKTYFAPESVFSNDAEGVPYIVREKMMAVEDIKAIYGVDVEPDEEIDIEVADKKTSEDKDDLKRAKVWFYEGRISAGSIDKNDEHLEKLGKVTSGVNYYIVLTADKMLHAEQREKHCAISRWFNPPTKFFGFGLGKTLRSYQKEMSIRRGQQVRYADLYAFPWLMTTAQTEIDQKAMLDVYKRTPLVYNGSSPAYLVPPTMPATLIDADNIARSDAQFVSGTLDLSKGAQETNTVKTATGQQLFAQSQDRRIQRVRASLGKYFRQVVVNLLEEVRKNWDEEKIISITDDDGNVQEVTVTKADIADIDFDTDIDIQLTSISMNKDTVAQRSIDLYDKVKDDPFVDRKKVFMKMLKDGYNVKNPERYMLDEGMEGTQPVQQIVDDGAEQQTGSDQFMGQQMAPDPQKKPNGYQ